MSDVNVKQLREKLQRLEGERASLKKEREALTARQEKLRAKSERSLAGVAVGKLLGQAESQQEQRIRAEGLQVAIGELDRRLAENQEAIDEAEHLIKWAAAKEMEARAEELVAEAREAMAPVLAKAVELEELADRYLEEGVAVYAQRGHGEKMGALSRVRAYRGCIQQIRRLEGYLNGE